MRGIFNHRLGLALCALGVFTLALAGVSPRAYAVTCGLCNIADCAAAPIPIVGGHASGKIALQLLIRKKVTAHNLWFGDVVIDKIFMKALSQMAQQFSSVAMMQAFNVGQLFDAKEQLDAQANIQELKFQAYKDYQPSQDFCVFGTGVRSLAASEAISHNTEIALHMAAQDRALGVEGNDAANGADQDLFTRWDRFTKTYCDRRNNNWQARFASRNTQGGTGLSAICKNNPVKAWRVNRDVDYARLIDQPRSIAMDLSDNAPDILGNEDDIMAMSENLYGHKVLDRRAAIGSDGGNEYYMKLRSIEARRSVARGSYNAIAALKAAGSGANGQSYAYLGAILKAMGMEDDQILEMIGEKPSLYAQLEILAKKIYQNPDFYAALYDTPANTERVSVALRAFEVMLDRAIYESRLRQEMLGSVLLATAVDNAADTEGVQ